MFPGASAADGCPRRRENDTDKDAVQHVFPGASMPFGMAKAVADTDNMDANLGGFTTDESGIRGFSQMHDSG